jgi:hypothetical protein
LPTGSSDSSDSPQDSATPEEPSEPTTRTTAGFKKIVDRGDFERRVRAIKTPGVLHDFMNRKEVVDWLTTLYPRVADECRAFAREHYRTISQPQREAAE